MSLVKTVADCSANVKVSANSICLLSVVPDTQQLKLEFSLNGSFLAYTFEDVIVEGGSSEELKRSVDLGSLASLKFSANTLTITLGQSNEGNTLEFKSGILQGKLLLSHPDVEKVVERARPTADAIDLNQQFIVSDFLSALAAHTYGTHHNAQEAAKRPVRIYSRKAGEDTNEIVFCSRDKITAASLVKTTTIPLKDDFNYYLYPKPLQAVLSSLSLDVSPVFHFGKTKDFWRVSHGQIDVWYPNIVPDVNVDLEELVTLVNTSPTFRIKTSYGSLKKALAELVPFTSSAHFFADGDMPIVHLVMDGGMGMFTLNTSKAKDVEIQLDSIEFSSSGLVYDPEDILKLNFKYLNECVGFLSDKKEKTDAKESQDDAIYLMWWPYKDTNAPTKGKALCLKRGNNYYWISRLIDQRRSV